MSPDSPVAASRVAREMVLAGDSLTMFPRRGHPGHLEGTRELPVTAPYIIVYRVSDTGVVTILRVWHAAQDRP